jgi:hypothetical protein
MGVVNKSVKGDDLKRRAWRQGFRITMSGIQPLERGVPAAIYDINSSLKTMVIKSK